MGRWIMYDHEDGGETSQDDAKVKMKMTAQSKEKFKMAGNVKSRGFDSSQ
jgi:hypothetical protein